MKNILSFFLLGLISLSVSCKEAEEFEPTSRELSQQEQDIMDKKWCAEKYISYDVTRKILTLFKLEIQERQIDLHTTTLAPGVVPPIQKRNSLVCGFSDMEFIINCQDLGMLPVKILNDQLVFPIMEEVSKFNECDKDQLSKF